MKIDGRPYLDDEPSLTDFRLGELLTFEYEASKKSKDGARKRIAVITKVFENGDLLTETPKSIQRFHPLAMVCVKSFGIVAEVV